MKFLFGVMLAFLSCLALVSAASIESCQLPHKANGDGLRSCAAFFPSWSYNSQANQCEEFIYGGCGGNANRFSSQEECERACKK